MILNPANEQGFLLPKIYFTKQYCLHKLSNRNLLHFRIAL